MRKGKRNALMVVTAVTVLMAVTAIVAVIVVSTGQKKLSIFLQRSLDAKENATKSAAYILARLNERNQRQVTTAPPSPNADVCLTRGCTIAAAEFIDAIDESVDPCDNIVQFVCNNWLDKNPVKDHTSSISQYARMRERRDYVLKQSLENIDSPSNTSAYAKVKSFYQSCLDTEAIETRGAEPLLSVLKEFGPWPVLDSTFDDIDFSIEELLVKFAKYRHYPIIEVGVELEDKNTSMRTLALYLPDLMMRKQYYYLDEHADILQEYTNLVQDILTMLAGITNEGDMMLTLPDTPSISVTNDTRDIVDFEIQLAKLARDAKINLTSSHQAVYNKFTIADLSGNISEHFNWFLLLSGVISLPGVDITITDQEPVYAPYLQYFREVTKLLRNTPKRTVANYAIWSFVYNRLGHISSEYRDRLRDFLTRFGRSGEERPRWLTCISLIQSYMPSIAGRMYVDREFDRDSKKTASDMIGLLRDTFSEIIDNLDWMDNITKQSAQFKLEKIQPHIGYPDWILNTTKLNEKWNEIVFDESQYFESYHRLRQKYVVDRFKVLHQKPDRSRWFTSPSTVNAFYNPETNQIVFPAGELQRPFFHRDYPKFVNFGRIGVIIGHEITHAFDSSGAQLDHDGSLRFWWTHDSWEKFQNESKCFTDQYASIRDPQTDMQVVKLNGVKTLGENIADNGAVREAYMAYHKWVEIHGRELRLPGLNYTQEQLFFMSYAYMRCTYYTDEQLKYSIRHGVHTPSQYRPIGAFQNSHEFAQAFQCPVGSFMNPPNKCKIW